MENEFTTFNKNHAIFLPAISSFYATFIGKQRFGEYIAHSRIPKSFKHGVESINFLNKDEGIFYYPYALYSAGHAKLDLNKVEHKEDMIRNRDRSSSLLVGDSGGFQIGKGVWEGDWTDSNCPKASKQRETVLHWLEGISDYAMCLDIPVWTRYTEKARKTTKVKTYQDAVNGTKINNEYFIKNRHGNTKFLNVLQGENHTEAEDWYEQMKQYCDPKKYKTNHFNGWAMGGQNMCDLHLALKRVITLKFDGLLEKGVHDWMHFLGTSRLEWAMALSDIQRAVRKYHNSNFTISYDCASPFLATANGRIYTSLDLNPGEKWIYRMEFGPDNKKYATDNRKFSQALLEDLKRKKTTIDNFIDSPVTEDLLISDVCIYKEGDVNKIGKEGKTSWDSFSYAIQMAHNVWMHLMAVRLANELYDSGTYPTMLVEDSISQLMMKDLITEAIRIDSKPKALKFLDDHSKFWMRLVGTRGFSGKKAMNATTQFNNLFEIIE